MEALTEGKEEQEELTEVKEAPSCDLTLVFTCEKW